MYIVILLACVPFILGGILGYRLAKKGINANNALANHQKLVYIILGISVSVVMAVIILSKLKLALLPVIIPLIIGEFFDKFIFSLGSFGVGLLIFIELKSWRNWQRLREMVLAVTIMTLCLGLLGYYLLPITPLLGQSNIVNNIVIQTTGYTCVPSSIATLGRYIGKYPNLSESDVVKLTHTNRFGTSNLAEIWALEKLGLSPEYKQNLTIPDLIRINKLAILHVNEPTISPGDTISHAIALLDINLEQKYLVVGNPLFGKQIKKFALMETGYWKGEAVFINHNLK
ncbi:MAG TPA: hypothetical protein V6C58_03795 [Allocoleopsis sp.]